MNRQWTWNETFQIYEQQETTLGAPFDLNTIK